MIDREKVIAGLTICAGTNVPIVDDMDVCILDCPYRDKSNVCVDKLMFDALTLLKEQPEIVHCNDCTYLNADTNICIVGMPHGHIDTFYCEYGKRRRSGNEHVK